MLFYYTYKMKQISSSQKKIRDFYTKYFEENSIYPTYEEAAIALDMSPAGVFKNIKWLEDLWILTKTSSWQIIRKWNFQELEVAWTISCGTWNDISDIAINTVYDLNEKIEVPTSMLPNNVPWYVLKADWDSMEWVGVYKNDYLVIKYQTYASEWDIVVAILKDNFEEKATLKEYRRTSKGLILQPHNSKFSPIVINESNPVEIRGKLVGVIRNY